VADAEMHRVFNCGIGMVIVVAPNDAPKAIAHLEAAGETAIVIGRIAARAAGDAPTIVI
jgi:phosphoribosylformylglycinamidine cyclo-ligase